MEREIDVDIDTAVFNEAYLPHLNNLARTQILFGGSSSGKSVFLAQRCVYDLMKGGRNYLICRQVARTMKTSVFAQVTRVIDEWGVGQLFNVNRSDFMITCQNGYQAVFIGLDDTEKVKSIVPATGAWTDIWLEEATETYKASLKQLKKRQRGGDEGTAKRLVLSFNPILQSHWIYKEYFSEIAWADEQKEFISPDLFILKTTYRDNRFLTDDDRNDLINEKDKYYFDVYSEGKWGVLGNVIFTNLIVADLNDPNDKHYLPVEQRTNRKHGGDFGFSSDPAAMAVTHYDRKHKTIYIYDELYETGLTNDLLAAEVIEKIGNDYIIWDSAEPKSIAELQQHGVNARSAKKGKDSVLFGIQWLQQQTIIIDKSCVNARNEFGQYKWKEDAAGNAIRQPVDKNNHLIDGLRYGYEDDMIETRVILFGA